MATGGLTNVDNGDGSDTISAWGTSTIIDNGDGTLTITDDLLFDEGDSTVDVTPAGWYALVTPRYKQHEVDRLRYKFDVAWTLYRISGTWHAKLSPSVLDTAGADVIFPGATVHPFYASAITAQGFSLTFNPDPVGPS